MRRLVLATLALGLCGYLLGPTVLAADKPAPKKDIGALVDDAFDLRGGRLRADQQDDFKRLRERYAPLLKSALQKVDQAQDEKEKTAAAKEAIRLRGEIRQGIEAILRMPDPTRPKPTPQHKPAQKKPNHKPANKPHKKK
jgi:hypothetical protein